MESFLSLVERGLFICPGMREYKVTVTLTFSPEGTLKDSPAVCRSGAAFASTAPLNSSWLPLAAIVLTALGAGPGPQSRDLRTDRGLALTSLEEESEPFSSSSPPPFTLLESDGPGSGASSGCTKQPG